MRAVPQPVTLLGLLWTWRAVIGCYFVACLIALRSDVREGPYDG